MAELKKEDVYFAAALLMRNEDINAEFIKEYKARGVTDFVTCAIETEAPLAEVTMFILWAIDELKPNDKTLYDACNTDLMVDVEEFEDDNHTTAFYY